MTGAVVGILVGRVAPFTLADPGAYALVGMGALFAGIVRAPLTSVFMIFELTQDYQIIVPLMVANLLSFYLSRRFQPLPLYHALLEQDHVHLPSAVVRGADRTWTAEHVMDREPTFVSSHTSVAEAAAALELERLSVGLVGDPPRLAGTVTASRLRESVAKGEGEQPVGPLVNRTPIHAHPDHPLAVVVERLADSDGIVPIVSRENTEIVLGAITVEAIMEGLRGRGGPKG
jgi:CIC family chloride channel protein